MKVPQVLIKDREGKTMTLTDCILVGKTTSDEEIAMTFSTTYDIPDTIKMVGSNIVLINKLLTAIHSTGAIPREDMESLIEISTLIASLKSGETHTEISYGNQTEEKTEEGFSENDFQKFLNYLRDKGEM